MSSSIQADPDDLDKHGRAFDGHVADMTAVHDELYSLLSGDIGIGHDSFSDGFRQNYLARVRDLADSVKGARDGVSGISQGMIKMAADYRNADDAALRAMASTDLSGHGGVSTPISPISPASHGTPASPANTADSSATPAHTTPHSKT